MRPPVGAVLSSCREGSGYVPRVIITDKIRSYGAAKLEIMPGVEHMHSAIRFVTPAQRHANLDGALLDQRKAVYEAARIRHPQRWLGPTRNWQNRGRVAEVGLVFFMLKIELEPGLKDIKIAAVLRATAGAGEHIVEPDFGVGM